MHFVLKTLWIRNFLGFGNKLTEIDLQTPGTLLIVGENIDRGGANGCGKSTITNAISYALYNKPLDQIGKELLINTTNNSKNTTMEVILEFAVGDINYKIKRGRGADYDTKLYIDGLDKTPDSIDNINKAIVNIVGVSYELFRRTVVFRGGDVPFFEMPLSQQRGLIEELFKITTLSEKAETLKKLNQNLEKDLEVLAAQILAQEKARDLRTKHISEHQARLLKWEADKASTESRLSNLIKSLSTIDYDEQEQILKAIEEIEPEYKKAETNKVSLEKEYLALEKHLIKIKSELKHLEEQKCPYCLQKFEGGESKIVELKLDIETSNKKYQDLEFHISTQHDIAYEAKQKLDELKPIAKYSSIRLLLAEKQNIITYESQFLANASSVNPHIEAYESLLNEQEGVVDYEKLDEYKSELEHQKFLLKLLIDKNSFIRKKIINRSVPFLNKQIHYHSKQLGLPHIVSFNPDMSCAISEYGRVLDYGNLSGGEKKRLNLSLSLAFRDMLHHLHSSINMLILDEVDAGAMDVIGVEAIIKAVRFKASEEPLMAVWIISHRPECQGRFDREMTVRFENGFSNIDRIETL